jgi:glyoxylase-like metal-dependent hydrolase (beta-lactamase superfamily II)
VTKTFDERKSEWTLEWEAKRLEWAARWDEKKPAPFRYTREVLPGLFQVRTRGSRAYLVLDDDITLIDTGNPGSGRVIMQAVKELGRSADEIRHIVVTHSHIDHVGGLPEMQKHIPAKTIVHVADAPCVASERPLPNPFTNPWLAKLLDGYLLRNDPGPARVDLMVDDGHELPVFGGMCVVHAPGHTPGSISLHFPQRGLLIVGDALQYKFGRLMLPSRMFTQDLVAAGESVRKLAGLDFEAICFSHFRPILEGADVRVREFAQTLAS